MRIGRLWRPLRVANRHGRMRTLSSVGNSGDSSNADGLTEEFSRFVNRESISHPSKNRKPSPFMSPVSVVEAQMDALQRNDWPDTDAGVAVAYLFSEPLEVDKILRAQPASPLVFHDTRKGNLAAMAVHVVPNKSAPRTDRGDLHTDAIIEASLASGNASDVHEHTFTFLLELIDEGAYKGCWLTVGVRSGDYANR
eukprot:gene24008-9581_t